MTEKKNPGVDASLSNEDVKHLKRQQKIKKQKFQEEYDLDALDQEFDAQTYNLIKNALKK